MNRSLLCALMLALTAMPAGAANLVKTYSYFSVGGRTLDDIQNQLSKNGPEVKSTGSRHPGATQMAFTTRISYAQSAQSCRITDAAVTVKVKVILPEWRRPRKSDPDVRLFWDTLSADIKRHEERHAEIARNHARQMEKSFSRLGAERSCKVLQARVAEVSRRELDDHDRDQARFDRIEAANFESRMTRLMRYRLSGRSAQD